MKASAAARPSLDRLRRAAVMICSQGPDGYMGFYGSGAIVAVSPDGRHVRVATCAHVWDACIEDGNRGASPRVLFFGDVVSEQAAMEAELMLARVERAAHHKGWVGGAKDDPTRDVAILDVPVAQPMPRTWLDIADEKPIPGTEVVAFGFPDRGEQPRALRLTAGWTQHVLPSGLVHCHLATFGGDSGAPVVSLATGQLLGLVCGGHEVTLPQGVVAIADSWLVPAPSIRRLLAWMDGRAAP